MKNRIKYVFSGIIISVLLIVYLLVSPTNSVLKDESSTEKINIGMLSMNFETVAGSGEYTTSSDNNWPTKGYTFNQDLSRCENNSELTWDETNKKVVIKSNISDKCYVYFDKEPESIS